MLLPANCLGMISLSNPLLLSGIALASLPVIAHLMHRWSRQNIVFPTIRLLQQSSAQQARLLDLRRRILLALRCLAVACLAAAFSRPIWYASLAAQEQGQNRRGVVILLDASLSTRQSIQGVPCFDSLRNAAMRFVDSMRSGMDQINVVVADGHPKTLFPALVPSLSTARSELASLEPSFEVAHWSQALTLAGSQLEEFQGTRQIVVLTDMQRSNWTQPSIAPSPATRLPDNTLVTLIDLKFPDLGNVALGSPRSIPKQPFAGHEVQLLVRVSNHSATTQQVPIQAVIGDTVLGSQTVILAAQEEREVVFSTTWPDGTFQTVRFEIPADALVADNVADLVVSGSTPKTIILVSDDDPRVIGNGSYFLQRALAPHGDATDRYAVRHISPRELGQESELNVWGSDTCLFLAYMGELSSEAATRIRNHLQRGGGVVLFCGEGAVERHMRQLEQQPDELAPARLLGLKQISGNVGGLRITSGAWRSPFLQRFDERSQLLMAAIRFRRVQGLGPLQANATALLTYEDGTPALLARPYGAGRFVLANFSPALDSSDLAKFGSFVALMQILAQELQPSGDAPSYLRVGTALQFQHDIPLEFDVRRISIAAPKLPAPRWDITQEGKSQRVQIAMVEMPGLYQLQTDGKPVESAAVLTDPLESNLTRLTEAELLNQLPDTAEQRQAHGLQGIAQSAGGSGRPLWGLCLFAAVVCLGLESFLLGRWRR